MKSARHFLRSHLRDLGLLALFLILLAGRLAIMNDSPNIKWGLYGGDTVEITGTIDSKVEFGENSLRFVIETPKHGGVLVTTTRYPEYKYGDKVRVAGRLTVPEDFVNDNGIVFRYKKFLQKDDIYYTIYRPEIVLLARGEGNPLISTLYSINTALVASVSRALGEPSGSLVSGMVFGEKQGLGTELEDAFRRTGLSHVLVLSGFNITILATVILSISGRYGKRRLGLAIGAVCIVLFCLMVGLTSTVVRASIMALCVVLARFIGREVSAVRTLFVAGGIMLIQNPMILLYDPSFQLSFMATLGLLLFAPLLSRIPFLGKYDKTKELVVSILAVELFLLPLLLAMMGEFSLVSPIANLVVLPLVAIVMFFGFTAGLLNLVFGSLAFVLVPVYAVASLLATAVIQIVIFFASLVQRFDFLTLRAYNTPNSIVVAWYALYLLVFTGAVRIWPQKQTS